MKEQYELEKQILTKISSQYEGIYQIDVLKHQVVCIHSGRNLQDADGVRTLEEWLQILLERCFDEDKDMFLQIFAIRIPQICICVLYGGGLSGYRGTIWRG